MGIPTPRRVTSLQAPELEPYRTLRRPVQHIRQGIFVAEGEKVVRRLLDSNLAVISLLLTEEWYEKLLSGSPLSSRPAPPNIVDASIYVAGKKLLESIVGFNLHQGIMAVARMPEGRSLDETLHIAARPYLLVALDGLVSAENVGVVVRNCAAFGVDAVISGETSSSPYLRRAVRNSMGAVFHLPVVHSGNLAESLRELSMRRQTCVVAATPQGSMTIRELDVTQNLCLVFGNEGAGVSPEILKQCQKQVFIPMADGVDSLNVASASAVFLYGVTSGRRDR
ncbi:MAG TPA: RNA methyltransferase [Bacteroidota bacterium]|nr:RNA methyltransferase [Bacteroidota bacterium]